MGRTTTYFKMDAVSMIRGMSREKPLEERLLLMDHIWSAYEVTGEEMMKSGAMLVTASLTSDMMLPSGQQVDRVEPVRQSTCFSRSGLPKAESL